MTHPVRELAHALRLTFQAIAKPVRRIIPRREPKPPTIGIESPAMDSMEQGQAWAMVAPDLWFMKRWERRTRVMCWYQLAGVLIQLAIPWVLGTQHSWTSAINAALAGFVLAHQDQSVRTFAAARAGLLKALEEHPYTEVRWYDESRLLRRREA